MAISLLLPVVSTSQPNLFDSVIRIVPRIRAWRFSSARPGSGPANGSASMSRNAAWAASIGTVSVRMPRLAASASASVDAALAREARRHEHADDVLGAERVGRDRGDERRVDAAGEADEHVGEAVLADVVAGAEHERLVDLVHRLEQRLDPRLASTAARRVGRSLTSTSGSARCAATAARVEQRGGGTRAARRRRRRAGPPRTACRGATRRTALVEQHRRAVEDELVLPADEVHVEHRHRRVGRARREHRLALADPAGVVRRRVDVHDELGARRRPA